MVPRCYLRQNPPFTENHDLPSFPRPTLPCNLPPRCPFFLPHVSFTSRLVVPPLSLLHAPSYVCSNNHLLGGGVTIEKQLEKHAGNWSPERAQMFFTKTLWNDRYLGGGSTSSSVWAAEMQNKPPFNKCLRHCILQRSYVVVVPEDLVFSFLYQQTLFCRLSHWRLDQTGRTP